MTTNREKNKTLLAYEIRRRPARIATSAALIIGALIMFFPFYWAFIGSLKTKAELWQMPPTFLPETALWSNYTEALNSGIPLYIFNSIFYAGMVTLYCLISSAMLAYVLVRFDFRLKKPLFIILLSMQMIPGAITHIPAYVILADWNLLDSYTGLIISCLANIYSIFLLRQYFLQVDKGLLEAAEIDGAGDMRILWSIMVPVSKPAVVMIVLNLFIIHYNSYIWPMLITKSPEKYLVSQGLQAFFVQEAAYGSKLPQLMAANIMVIIPMLVLFAFTQKWFESGVAGTGAKG